jgi:hypothetical protein
MKPFQWGALLAVVLSAFFLASCGDNAKLESITVSPATPEFVCCSTTTQQFTATAHFSNKKTADFTNIVAWSSQDSTEVSIDSHGLATVADSCGQFPNIVITASFNPKGKLPVSGTAEWLGIQNGC